MEWMIQSALMPLHLLVLFLQVVVLPLLALFQQLVVLHPLVLFPLVTDQPRANPLALVLRQMELLLPFCVLLANVVLILDFVELLQLIVVLDAKQPLVLAHLME